MHQKIDLKKFAKVIFIAGLTVFLFSKTSNAATYYASPSGSAAWAQANDINNPCSPVTAFMNARAGDTVYFRGGNYYLPQSTSYEAPPSGYSIANSGTVGNPIVFQAYTGEVPKFIGHRGWAGNEMVMMLSNASHTNITLDGFIFEAFNGANGTGTRSTPEISLYSNTNVPLNIIVQNCTFTGTTISLQDNHHMIWLGGPQGCYASYVTIQSNLFLGMQSSASNTDYHGVAAIMPYGYNCAPNHITIKNNEFKNCSVGIFFKGGLNPPATNFDISNNFFNGVECAVAFNPNGGDYTSVNNNIMVLTRLSGSSSRKLAGIDFDGYQGNYPTNNAVYNNTIYSTDSVANASVGIGGRTRETPIYNNIIKLGSVGSGEKTGAVWLASGATLSAVNNNNFGNSPFLFYVNGASYSTISALQAATLTINTSSFCSSRQPCNNISASPIFTNASGNFSLPSDFLLSSNSPGYRAGSDGNDMGANINLVGRGNVGVEGPRPPSNLRFN